MMKHSVFFFQIVDMDGAYAPDSAVIEDVEAVKPVYSVTEIRTAYPE